MDSISSSVLLSLVLILLSILSLQYQGGTVLYYKVIALKEEGATFFYQFLEPLVMLTIFLKKGMYYLEKARIFLSFAKQRGISKPGFCSG